MNNFARIIREMLAGSLIPFYHALREVGVTAILALTPVWAGVILSLIVAENQTLGGAMRLNTARGDLFLLSSAAISPVLLYVTIKRDDFPKPVTRHFPGGWFYILCLVLVFGASVLLFAVKRLMDTGGIDPRIEDSTFFMASLVVYTLALGLAVVVTFVKERIEKFSPDAFRSGDKDFTSRWLGRDD